MKIHYSLLATKTSQNKRKISATLFCGNLFLQFDITTNTNLVCLHSIGTYSKAVFACRLQTKLDSLLMKIHCVIFRPLSFLSTNTQCSVQTYIVVNQWLVLADEKNRILVYHLDDFLSNAKLSSNIFLKITDEDRLRHFLASFLLSAMCKCIVMVIMDHSYIT